MNIISNDWMNNFIIFDEQGHRFNCYDIVLVWDNNMKWNSKISNYSSGVQLQNSFILSRSHWVFFGAREMNWYIHIIWYSSYFDWMMKFLYYNTSHEWVRGHNHLDVITKMQKYFEVRLINEAAVQMVL